jgi:predicted CoA-substrate-specific enzyme activase
LDIGGEDSKLMLVEDSLLADFQMNRDCGGGTGSMIETIAARLGVTIEEVGEIALQSKDPAVLPGKCGIFCQSAAVSQLSKGRPTGDILIGVCKALVGNYLATLAKGKKLLPPIVFQGATAQNAALVKCFEDALGYRVLVPENCSYMGAIGIAILTEENMNGQHTRFRGDAILDSNHRTEIAHCDGCENNCELLKLYCGDELLGVSGSRCGKHNR